MLLQYLLEDLENVEITGNTDKEIKKIQYNSKKIEESDIFVCIDGYNKKKEDIENIENKKTYIEEAVLKGAVAIIIEKDFELDKADEYIQNGVTIIKVESSRKALAIISSKYFEFPEVKLNIIGVTGTKGKTTTSYMIRDILNASGKKTVIIGTMYNLYSYVKSSDIKTYKESLDLYETLNELVKDEVKYVVLEVGTTDVLLDRIYGINFATTVFTNLCETKNNITKTLEDNLEVKSKLFNMSKYCFVNGDDIYTPRLLKNVTSEYATFGLDNSVDLTAVDIRINVSHVEFKVYVNKMLETIKIKIPGRFVVYDALAAIGVASLFNCQMDAITLALQGVKVPGRSEVLDINKIFTVMLDCANSITSVEATLSSVKKYAKGRIICVFDCHCIEEEKEKLGEILGKYSDFVIITAKMDKNKTKCELFTELENGLKSKRSLYKIFDGRESGIKFGMRIAWKNDIILILGSQNENSQNKKKIVLDERVLIQKLAQNMEEKNIIN